jgi:hypothetical protein
VRHAPVSQQREEVAVSIVELLIKDLDKRVRQ